MSNLELEQVKRLAQNLSPAEKAELAEWLVHTAKPEQPPRKSRRPMYGLCADLGPGPTDEDIEEIRREMWKNFPREDF